MLLYLLLLIIDAMILAKITIILSIFFMHALISNSQNITTLSGNIKGLDPGSKVYLSQTSRAERLDSLVSLNELFKFKLKIKKGDVYFVTFFKNSSRFDYAVYLQNGSDTHLTGIPNSTNLKYTGSELAKVQDTFYKKLYEINSLGAALEKKISQETDTVLLNKLKVQMQTHLVSLNGYYWNWLKNHNNSPFSVAIINLYMPSVTTNTNLLEDFYNQLPKQAKENNLITKILPFTFARMRENEKLKIGDFIKDFVLRDTAGIAHTISSYKNNNYILIDIWASWCAPCRKSTPEIIKLLKTYDKQFSVISISADTDKEKWKEAIVKDNMSWTQLSDLKGTESGFMKDSTIFAFPTYLIISPEGVIVSKPWSIEGVKSFFGEIFSKRKSIGLLIKK